MRISGLSSGLDIDAIVKQLMTAQRAPLDKLNQQKQQTEWKRDDYREISTKLVSFNEKLSSLSLSSAIDAKKATVSGASVVTATATGAATNSVYNIQVKNMASATNVIYQGTVGATKISDIYSGSQTSLTIGSATIDFSSSDSIDSLVTKINNNKDAGVTAVFDSTTGKLSLTSKTTGNDPIVLGGDFFDSTKNTKLSTSGQTPGEDATVVINGIESKQASNRFTVNGVEFTITGVTPTGQSSQVEVTQDTDKMVDTIKKFAETYNESLALLNKKTGEERYRTFLPLTSEQKEAMTDDEIKLWEEKAQSGLLRNDSILSKAASDMRTALFADFTLPNGTKMNLTQLGITTGSYSEKGKLYIDETKLREAIESNPEGVNAFFGQIDSSATVSNNAQNGIFNRVKKINTEALQSLYDRAGTSKYSSDLTTAFLPESEIGKQLRDFDTRISDMNSRLTLIENRYYKQFTAMETAMNKYNSVSSSLFSS
ncbi:flagellar filament capping protein FliD [Paenibacillus timonensis]|uniref:flagellar filament capping protein FliD n=1 Tax=Paenibacillus timonensis TaxID=225915 RepID=UPI003F95A1AB